MTKRLYLNPMTEVIEADMKDQLLSVSIADVATDGLGDDNLIFDDQGDDPANALSRFFIDSEF